MPWLTDDLFAAGGDFAVQDWPDFQLQMGVSAVVVVSASQPERFGAPRPWALLWLPVADEQDYTLDHLRLGVQFMAAAAAAGQKVLLHGPQGMHRTRPLAAAWLVAHGRSLRRVLREMEQKPWLPPYRGDPALLEQLGAALRGE